MSDKHFLWDLNGKVGFITYDSPGDSDPGLDPELPEEQLPDEWTLCESQLPSLGNAAGYLHYGDGVWVIRRNESELYYTDDGARNWKTASTNDGIFPHWYGYGNGVWIGGDSQKIYRSTDEAVTWNGEYINKYFTQPVWASGQNQWVMAMNVGQGLRHKIHFMLSTDNGETWVDTENTALQNIRYETLAYSPTSNRLVAAEVADVANTVANVLTSTDGINWSVPSTVPNKYFLAQKVIAGDQAFILIGKGALWISDANGDNWEEIKNIIGSTSDLNDAAYGDGVYIVCGTHLSNGTRYSLDGRTWVQRDDLDAPDMGGIRRIGYTNGCFMLIDADGRTFKISSNALREELSK